MKIYENEVDLDHLLELAKKSPRKRASLPLHDHKYGGTRFIFNALLPGTYVRPHKHELDNKNEIIMVYRGSVLPLEFSDEGEILPGYKEVKSSSEIPLVELSEKIYNTILIKEPTVIAEIMKGPYVEETHKTFADWAPSEEDEIMAQRYLKELREKTGFI